MTHPITVLSILALWLSLGFIGSLFIAKRTECPINLGWVILFSMCGPSWLYIPLGEWISNFPVFSIVVFDFSKNKRKQQ